MKILIKESAMIELNLYEETLQAPRALAAKVGITKPESDSGFRTAQVLYAARTNITFCNLKGLPGKYGSDAKIKGVICDWEIKTLDCDGKLISNKKFKSFRVSSHVSIKTILRYEINEWLFGLFHEGRIFAVYWISPEYLKHYFEGWKKELFDTNRKYVNSPSIDVNAVIAKGTLIFQRNIGLLFPVKI